MVILMPKIGLISGMMKPREQLQPKGRVRLKKQIIQVGTAVDRVAVTTLPVYRNHPTIAHLHTVPRRVIHPHQIQIFQEISRKLVIKV